MVKKATLIPFLENTHLYDSKKSTKPTLKSLGNPFYFTQGIAKSFCFQSRLQVSCKDGTKVSAKFSLGTLLLLPLPEHQAAPLQSFLSLMSFNPLKLFGLRGGVNVPSDYARQLGRAPVMYFFLILEKQKIIWFFFQQEKSLYVFVFVGSSRWYHTREIKVCFLMRKCSLMRIERSWHCRQGIDISLIFGCARTRNYHGQRFEVIIHLTRQPPYMARQIRFLFLRILLETSKSQPLMLSAPFS